MYSAVTYVCLSMSKAKPEGHVICLSPALVHLQCMFFVELYKFVFAALDWDRVRQGAGRTGGQMKKKKKNS